MKPNLFSFPDNRKSDSDLDDAMLKEIVEQALIKRRNMRRDQAEAAIKLSSERAEKALRQQDPDVQKSESQGLFIHPTPGAVN